MNVKQEIQDKIVAAASALVAEGVKNPTNDQVRERMGGGSLSHISPVMREWRQSRQEEVVAALEIPPELKKNNRIINRSSLVCCEQASFSFNRSDQARSELHY